jgi:hypothetical protein
LNFGWDFSISVYIRLRFLKESDEFGIMEFGNGGFSDLIRVYFKSNVIKF